MNFKEDKNTIEMGSHETLIIDKLYGPTVFAELRITPDASRGWVIERQWASDSEWIEWCVIPAQIDQEFDETQND